MTGTLDRPLSDSEREQRRAAATRHGARSQLTVKRVATTQKRRLLRQIGLRAADLSGVGLGYLDAWARAQSKVELMDSWAAEHGWLSETGESPPFVREYYAAINCARLALTKFAEHLKASGRGEPSMVAQLQHHARGGDVVPIAKGKR